MVAVVLAAVLSGLYGSVSRGPIMPVCQAGQPCSKPAVGIRLSFVRHGVVVKSVVTTAKGRYRVVLPPGSYAVRVKTSSRIDLLKPQTVAVHDGVMSRQNFFIDTGIR